MSRDRVSSQARPSWLLDELATAGRENLDAGHVSRYDSKENADAGRELSLLVELGLSSESVVVEFGSGTGQFALTCLRIVAVDVSPVMLAAARARIDEAQLANVEFVQAGFLAYEHRGRPADFVYSRLALHHLPDFWKASALVPIHDILRPGGLLRLVDVAYSFAPQEAADRIEAWCATAAPSGGDVWTRVELEEHVRDEHSTYTWLVEPMLERAGFAIEDAEYSDDGILAKYVAAVPEPQRTASGVRYAYRDGDAAAERLAAVNELFEPPYRSLIEAAHPGTVDLAIDVGCGPGFTTRLLSAVLKPRSLAGLDISAHFIKQARASGPPDIAWYVHDVTQVPFPTGPADLIHSRWVLAHLANPETVLVSWLSQLRPRGRLLIQEDEQIDAEHPVLAAYQAMSTSLVVHHGGDLYVARRIDRLQIPPGYRTTLNRLYPHNVPAPAAARIFAMNFAIWRDDPWITENHTTRELDAMASDLDRIATSTEHSEVVFTLHQFAFAHVTAPE